MAKYKSIDLFAGIGGIRLGFDRAFGDEISTVFVSEWDEYAQKTYKANFDDNFEIAGDITKINEKDKVSNIFLPEHRSVDFRLLQLLSSTALFEYCFHITNIHLISSLHQSIQM